MKSFHTIAVPHKDILEGRLTMDIFAADLWEVMKNRGPDEYKDAETFFRKTYLTEGLKNLLAIIEKRIQQACNGANWQKAFVAKYGADMTALTKAYVERQTSGTPVHNWDL